MEELKRIIISKKPDSKVHHYHIIDWRSSKVVITIVCLSVLLLASLFGNVQQFIVNSRMTDNDLKYRYIKSKNGITPESLNEIENICQYNRDKKPIGEIRQNLENYERQLIERIEQMEKNQLK
jgi:transcriptional regulator of heat shock response